MGKPSVEADVVVTTELDQAAHHSPEFPTSTACLIGLAVVSLCGAGSFIAGLIVCSKPTIQFRATRFVRDLLPLIINILLTVGTEVLGFVHATTLKWALFHEGRLNFNANLRLLTSSSTSAPNSAYSNALYLIALAVCYASCPLILVTNNTTYDNDDALEDQAMRVLSGPALLCLGGSLLIMCAICVWSLYVSDSLVWSSCPLATLALAIESGQPRRLGRAMMSVESKDMPATGQKPTNRQCSAYSACKQVRWVVVGLVSVLLFLIIKTTVTFAITPNAFPAMPGWGMVPVTSTPDTVLNIFIADARDKGRSPAVGLLCGLLITAGFQSILTIGMHCAELQITLARDEKIWRSISSNAGRSTRSESPLRLRIGSWESITLIIFVPVIHWQYGLAVTVDYLGQVHFYVPQMCYLTMMWALFLGFALSISLRRPRGPLPATYGHVQCMLDLTDEWANHIFWGDKGHYKLGDVLRTAGTADTKLPEPDMRAEYA